MALAIRTEQLSKRYGDTVALRDLDLEVPAGEIFGFLGPNGAGKTTTIRVLLDLIRPSSGRAEVLGLDTRRDSIEVRQRIGYLPGELVLYEKLTARQLLEHFAHLRGGVDWTHVTHLAERLDLGLDHRLGSLSKGNKQKVGLVQAFMNRPELLLLDEPTGGLDPLVQEEVHELFREARAEGATVFLSSHVLHEVEHVADRVGVIRSGQLAAVERVADMKARAVRRLHATLSVDPPIEQFRSLANVIDCRADGRHLDVTFAGSPDAVVKHLGHFEVLDLLVDEPDLEEIFLTFYGDGREEPEEPDAA